MTYYFVTEKLESVLSSILRVVISSIKVGVEKNIIFSIISGFCWWEEVCTKVGRYKIINFKGKSGPNHDYKFHIPLNIQVGCQHICIQIISVEGHF